MLPRGEIALLAASEEGVQEAVFSRCRALARSGCPLIPLCASVFLTHTSKEEGRLLAMGQAASVAHRPVWSVLKGTTVNDRSDVDIESMKARLIERRDELAHLAEGAAEAREPVELDQTRVGRLSRMDALQSQAMSLETDRRRQVALRRIEAALSRIEEGEFGYCIQCGEPIARRRLELDPTSPNCIACASAGA